MAILEVGDTFAGCIVRESKDTPRGHAWVFSRGNEAVCIEIKTEDYIDYMITPYERERILDQMAADVYQALKDKESKIWSR